MQCRRYCEELTSVVTDPRENRKPRTSQKYELPELNRAIFKYNKKVKLENLLQDMECEIRSVSVIFKTRGCCAMY